MITAGSPHAVTHWMPRQVAQPQRNDFQTNFEVNPRSFLGRLQIEACFVLSQTSTFYPLSKTPSTSLYWLQVLLVDTQIKKSWHQCNKLIERSFIHCFGVSAMKFLNAGLLYSHWASYIRQVLTLHVWSCAYLQWNTFIRLLLIPYIYISNSLDLVITKVSLMHRMPWRFLKNMVSRVTNKSSRPYCAS